MRVSFPAASIKKWISEKRSIFFRPKKSLSLSFAAPDIFQLGSEECLTTKSPRMAGSLYGVKSFCPFNLRSVL